MAEGPYQTRHSGPQPTALTSSRVDLSPASSRASAAGRRAYVSDRWSADWEKGYVWRTEACACRGQMVVPFPCPDSVVAGVVRAHNASLLHMIWRKRMFPYDYWRAAA